MSAPYADRDHSEQPSPHTGMAGSDPTQGTSRSVSARVVRASEAQVEAAQTWGVPLGLVLPEWFYRAVADAVVAAGDADEVTRLRAEVERLNESAGVVWADMNEAINAASDRAEKAEAEVAQLRRTVDIQDRLLGSHADGHRCTCTMVDPGVYHGDNMHPPEWEQDPWCPTHPDADYIRQRFEKAEAEREWLAEVVARVEALADEWEGYGHGEFNIHPDVGVANSCAACAIVRGLRAALSGPTPAETPQNGPEPALSREQGTSGQSGEGEALRGAENGVPSIGDTCCGKCSGGTCYVDGVTGA